MVATSIPASNAPGGMGGSRSLLARACQPTARPSASACPVLRPQAETPAIRSLALTGDAAQPAGDVPNGWRRRCPRATAVLEPPVPASVGLVSHHDAPDRAEPDGQRRTLTREPVADR